VADGGGGLRHAAAASSIRFCDSDCERHRRERKRLRLFGSQHLLHDYGHINAGQHGARKKGECGANHARAVGNGEEWGGGGGDMGLEKGKTLGPLRGVFKTGTEVWFYHSCLFSFVFLLACDGALLA
jgi:hypothetical protein